MEMNETFGRNVAMVMLRRTILDEGGHYELLGRMIPLSRFFNDPSPNFCFVVGLPDDI